MKFAIISLCLLGVVAAACAALLIKGMRSPVIIVQTTMPTTQPAPEVQPTAQVTVLYAARALAPMTVVDGSMITCRTIPAGESTKGYFSNASDVVGKVVKQTVAEGQPYSTDCFLDEGDPRLVAGVIPAGMRAVGISVADYAGLDGLIVPGSKVDVMATVQPIDKDGKNTSDKFTTIVVENVQVLAFEQHTVLSSKKSPADVDAAAHTGGMRRVYLLVDIKQAKTLVLGMTQDGMGKGGSSSTLSLVLRNPVDASVASKERVSVGTLFGEETTTVAPPPPVSSLFNTSPPTTQPVDPAHWDVIVMRGGSVETHSFVLPTVQEGIKP